MHAPPLMLTPQRLAPGMPGGALVVGDDLPALLAAVIERLAHAKRLLTAPAVELALQQLQPLLLQHADELARCEAALQSAQREVVRLRASHLRAQQLSLHDGLTTLPNRNFFQQRMAQALWERRLPPGPTRPRASLQAELAVLVLDLDGFKAVNDRHGHAAGDELLRIVGLRLQRALRRQDMVCRLGGDEFACMLGEVPSRLHLSHLAVKLIDTVAAPVSLGGLQVSVRPSIGIAQWPFDGNTTELLLRHADTAMFRAKRQHLGHAFFEPACCDVEADACAGATGAA